MRGRDDGGITMTAFRYDGQRVVLTGAATGIGAATARMLADAGAEVHALDVADVDGPVTSARRCDLSDPGAIDAAVDAIGAPVHKLFNVAGVPQTLAPEQVLRVNVLGLRHLTEQIVPLMPAGGAITSVASLAGAGWANHLDAVRSLLETPDVGAGVAWCHEHLAEQGDPYFFSKECVIVYTMLRAKPLGRVGIRINCVSPGPVDSPMMPAFREALGSTAIDWTAAESAVGRLATPDDVAPALVFLGADECAYLTGVDLVVDAGFTTASAMGQVDLAALGA